MKNYISKIKEQASRHKTLIQNFSYLSALQIFNMLLPLITYPYLIRVLGKETYGLVIFAQAVIGYLSILVGFGFNMSATKEISLHRSNVDKISEIVSSVILIKSLLFLISLVILAGLLYFLPEAHGFEMLFILTIWICLYDVLFPQWYFQGIEQMKYITYLTLVSRILFFVLIFIFIKSPDDYLLFPLISGIGGLIAGLASLYIIFMQHRVKFIFPPYQAVVYYFKESVPIFISGVSVKIYVSTNKVILGAFLGMSEVAYYDLAEKIITIFRIPQSILSQALFPKISNDRNIKFIISVFRYTILANIAFTVFVILFSKPFVILLGGDQLLPAVNVLLILAFTIPIIATSSFLGIQVLVPFGYSREYSQAVIASGVVYLVSIFLLWIGENITLVSLAYVTLLTEFFVTAYMYYFCSKNKILTSI